LQVQSLICGDLMVCVVGTVGSASDS